MTDLRVERLLEEAEAAQDVIRLDYDARLARRKRLVSEGGQGVLLDLPELTDLSHFAGLELENGTQIALEAAAEPVLVIRGDLPRLAWHIGNRHTPCQMGGDHLVIRADHVLRGMLEGLGADVSEDSRPFRPEGGAYGHGRTMGHDHAH